MGLPGHRGPTVADRCDRGFVRTDCSATEYRVCCTHFLSLAQYCRIEVASTGTMSKYGTRYLSCLFGRNGLRGRPNWPGIERCCIITILGRLTEGYHLLTSLRSARVLFSRCKKFRLDEFGSRPEHGSLLDQSRDIEQRVCRPAEDSA